MSNPLDITAPEGLPFLDFQRVVDAPREAVFRAHTEPDLLVQWLGPRNLVMTVDEFDARPGGAYHYTHRDENGSYGFRGCFHTVREDLLIQTFEFDGWPDGVSLDTLRLVDLGDGRTRLEGRSVFGSVEDRDGAVASGMEQGMADGYELLDALLSGRPIARAGA
ncbi:SRPBCC family protein [Ornithinimicrobium cavernae]|uniref:SRPBCC family protein n=1 Tax=Ornithinimicrobium cavernae TaxID=2666047 RepID=UPI000D695D96|nr:SRPBCC family protein [Ornithinimicrobium cavernae]